MKNRVWELDAFRGLCVLGMVAVHLVYDLVDLYGLAHWQYPAVFSFIRDWGGVLFILLSGICVTLGSRSVRRGAAVFACGMLCTAVTYGMYRLGMAGKGIIIRFGVLHCLGICMLLWPLLRRCPVWLLGVSGAVITAVGLSMYIARPKVAFPYLAPLGIVSPDFASADYFPLFPFLGFFLLGAVLGKTLYRDRKTLLSGVNPKNPVIRLLSLCGKHSLSVYLLHQPLIAVVLFFISRSV